MNKLISILLASIFVIGLSACDKMDMSTPDSESSDRSITGADNGIRVTPGLSYSL
ncbi:MAG: hypothetical protein OQL19_06440 [Gammaproteobacteria bacterium]|nr:hypothetical protein [Gammaproteobacteria bacterium]